MPKAFDPSTHARLRRYQLRAAPNGWWARVPYGTWRWFPSWGLAALWLATKHEERRIQAERRERRQRESERALNVGAERVLSERDA